MPIINYEPCQIIKPCINTALLDNILRSLSMLKKTVERVGRSNYYNSKKYPEVLTETMEILDNIITWTKTHKHFVNIEIFSITLGQAINNLSLLVPGLIACCKRSKGKKQISKKDKDKNQDRLFKSIANSLNKIANYIEELSENCTTEINDSFEKWFLSLFEEFFSKIHEIQKKIVFSIRGAKSYIFPWSNKDSYMDIVKDKKRFRAEVVEKLKDYSQATGHKKSCKRTGNYNLNGYRSNNRKTIIIGGKKKEFPIRMIICKDCGQVFSLIPSFLPREKHFEINMIGTLLRDVLSYAKSFQGAIESFTALNDFGRQICKETIYNWLGWIGHFDPATILIRAGITGSGYLQEDEGFEKEPGLRTYSVVMVDPENMLVWHSDYVDHVDEDTLCSSFEAFYEKINFRINGVTKDKWKASTNALKKVFHRIWIGYCHRHCLKNFRGALSEYQKQTNCDDKKVADLFQQFMNVLKTSTSKVNMEVKIRSLDDPAFANPILYKRVEELMENAVQYTCHNKRNGIKPTTSLVDNFLKIVKRKLNQVESFRDKECTKILFRAMATVRNFCSFGSGSKNAHKSPFMLAQGQTYNLQWMQVLNVHNAFLDTDNTL